MDSYEKCFDAAVREQMYHCFFSDLTYSLPGIYCFFIDKFRLSDSLTNWYIYINGKKTIRWEIKPYKEGKRILINQD